MLNRLETWLWMIYNGANVLATYAPSAKLKPPYSAINASKTECPWYHWNVKTCIAISLPIVQEHRVSQLICIQDHNGSASIYRCKRLLYVAARDVIHRASVTQLIALGLQRVSIEGLGLAQNPEEHARPLRDHCSWAGSQVFWVYPRKCVAIDNLKVLEARKLQI